jgi:hypothetical protein
MQGVTANIDVCTAAALQLLLPCLLLPSSFVIMVCKCEGGGSCNCGSNCDCSEDCECAAGLQAAAQHMRMHTMHQNCANASCDSTKLMCTALVVHKFST